MRHRKLIFVASLCVVAVLTGAILHNESNSPEASNINTISATSQHVRQFKRARLLETGKARENVVRLTDARLNGQMKQVRKLREEGVERNNTTADTLVRSNGHEAKKNKAAPQAPTCTRGDPFTLRGLPESFLPLPSHATSAQTHAQPTTPILRKKDGTSALEWFDSRSCAVVGNSGSLLLKRFGSNIDGHSAVIRQNQAPTRGYEKHVGGKTSIRMLNKIWLKRYAMASFLKWLPLEPNMSLVASRGEPPLMARLRAAHPRAVTLSSVIGSGVRKLMAAFRQRRKCAGLNTRYEGGSTPSSGIYSVALALALCERVTVYGFGTVSQKSGKSVSYQYYRLRGTERSSGNPVHSFEAERALIKALAKDGYLTFCTEESDRNCGAHDVQ